MCKQVGYSEGLLLQHLKESNKVVLFISDKTLNPCSMFKDCLQR